MWSEYHGGALTLVAMNGQKCYTCVWLSPVIVAGHNEVEAMSLLCCLTTAPKSPQKANYGGHRLEQSIKKGMLTWLVLVKRGAEINKIRAALTTALVFSHVEIVTLLCAKGADANAADKRYGVSLLATSIDSHKPIVQFLLDQKAKVSKVTDKRGSPLLERPQRRDRAPARQPYRNRCK
ncbi:hypothetical protein BKA66DRAFT_448284 [Pyrenochaeta sp. MPI-SDFR-AT-0127]|nr:hypothetical protein BKA66DRAFT_448284 [Pyrenochaeta sp. MPI-SDFR-AT-0127]